MAVLDNPTVNPKSANPKVEALFVSEEAVKELQAIVAQQFEEFGIKYESNATADDAQRAMLADGIRPEDNFLSRAIIAAREE